MDDSAQLKKQLDDIVSVLNRRLSDAYECKTRAEREAKSSEMEIAVILKAVEDFKPLQGYYGSLSVAQAAIADAVRTERGSNREIVIQILSSHGGPMTNGEIAKVAYEQGKIKSKKGQKGVYATVATVLARGKHIFINLNGQWELRSRRAAEGPVSRVFRGDISGLGPPPVPPVGPPLPTGMIRVAKVGSG